MIAKLCQFSRTPAAHSLFIMKIRATSLVVKFLFTLFIARFMGFEALGTYGLIAAGGVMAPGLIGFSLMYTMARKAITLPLEEVAWQMKNWAKFMMALHTFMGLISIGIAFYTGQYLLVMLIWLVILLEHLNNDLYTLLLNLSQPMIANILHFVRNSVWMLIAMLISYFVPEFRTIEFICVAWICGSLMGFSGFLAYARKWPWHALDKKVKMYKWAWSEFWEARAIYAAEAFATASSYVNHFLITLFLGLDLTGVYVFFMQAYSAMANLLQTGVIQIARPKLVRAFKEKSADYIGIYKKCMMHTLTIACAMSVCAWFGMYILVHYVVDRPLALEWFPAFALVLVIFVAGMSSQVNRLVFYSQHLDGLVLKLNLFFTPISVGLSVVMISLFGMWGALSAPIVMICVTLSVYFYNVKILFEKYAHSLSDANK